MASDMMKVSDMVKAYDAEKYGLTHTPQAPLPSLTVAEIERLAKAGVAVDLSKVCVQPSKLPYFAEDRDLMSPLIHRLRLAFPINSFSDQRFSYMSAARIADEKVALMVVTAHGNAQLLEDDLKSFPSDTLMAKLHLLLETEKKRNIGGYAEAGQAETPRAMPPPLPNVQQQINIGPRT